MYKLPALSELDWINKLERLYIIKIDNSLLVFHHNFQALKKEEFEIDEKSTMEGSALAGINLLLKEILESDSSIKEIDYSDKKMCFNQGKKTIAILIASSSSNEFNYRLEMFHLSFEKRYLDLLENWDGELSQFYKADEIVKEYFL